MFNFSLSWKKKQNIFFNVPLIYDELSFFFLSSVSRQHKLSNSAAVYSRTQIEDLEPKPILELHTF